MCGGGAPWGGSEASVGLKKRLRRGDGHLHDYYGMRTHWVGLGVHGMWQISGRGEGRGPNPHLCPPPRNYGPTIALQQQAQALGCQQVLWLQGPQRLLTEVGTMNLFIFWHREDGGMWRGGNDGGGGVIESPPQPSC